MQGNSVVLPTRSSTSSAEADISSRLKQQKIPAGFWGADSLGLKQEPLQVLVGMQEHHVSVSFFSSDYCLVQCSVLNGDIHCIELPEVQEPLQKG